MQFDVIVELITHSDDIANSTFTNRIFYFDSSNNENARENHLDVNAISYVRMDSHSSSGGQSIDRDLRKSRTNFVCGKSKRKTNQ